MRHVLVIEDTWLFAQLVADVALCAGASSVAIADSEESAVELARAHRPFLILSDVDLCEGGRGPDAVIRIREEHGPVPTIFITGVPVDPDSLDGAAAVLAKPVTVDRLIDAFNQAVGRRPAARPGLH